MKDFRRYVWRGAAFAALVLGIGAWRNRRWFTVHDVTTGESVAYPELRSRIYYGEPEEVLQAADLCLKLLPKWRSVQMDLPHLAVDAKGPSLLTVYVVSCGHGQARAVVRSASQGKFGDWGRNAALIQELQDLMDKRLTQNAAI